MLITYRYISITLIRSILFVLLLLLGMDLFIQMANEMIQVSRHSNYGLMKAFQYVFYAMPNELYNFFPMAGLVGSLWGLGSLANHNELVVMEAIGMSRWQIIKAVLITILSLVIITTWVGETLGPLGLHQAEAIKIEAKSDGQVIHTTSGFWFRDDSDFIHVAHITPDFKLQTISRYHFDAHHQLKKIAYAKEGIYQQKKWQVTEVQETLLTPTHTEVLTKAATTWSLHLKPQVLKIAQEDPHAMTLRQLAELIDYKKHNYLHYQHEALIYWQRLCAPLAISVMMILAIPFIFGPLRKANLGLRMITGILIGFSFYTLNQFLGSFTLVYGFPPLLGAIFPTIGFALLSIVIIFYTRKN